MRVVQRMGLIETDKTDRPTEELKVFSAKTLI
jgi:hypothetical protein